MARWWRSSARKPSTSSGENDAPGAVTPEAEGGTATAAASRIKRTILRRGKKDETTTTTPPPPPTGAPNDPAKPFTQQNLEHQRILGNFSWPAAAAAASGGRKPSRGAKSYASGVSPSTSRTTSVDDDAAAAGPRSPRSPPRAPADRRSLSGRLRRSLAAANNDDAASPQAHVPTAVLPGGVSDAHRQV